MAAPRIPGRVKELISRFRRDRRANVAITFGIATIPILGMVGAATDYSLATRVKAKLSSAADTAVVASVSLNSAGWKQAMQMTSDGPVPNGVSEADGIFKGNANTMAASFTNLQEVSLTVTKAGGKLTSTLQWSADVPVTFMRALGWQHMSVGGTSTATSTMPLYLDFYLMLDVSGSMGLPSTQAEAQRLQSISPDDRVSSLYPSGCTLACHFAQPPLNQLNKSACIDPSPNTPTGASPTQQYPTGNYCLGYEISRISQTAYAKLLQNHGGQLPAYKYTSKSSPPTQVAQPGAFYSVSPQYPNDPILTPVSSCPTPGTDACIQLRLDAVGYAVNALLAYANSKEILTNQFRVALYPYINSLYSGYATLTSSINGNPNTAGTINYAAANLATLLDTNQNANLGSGGTNQDAALSAMNSVITSVGDGTASNNTLPYVFIVTDGAVTPQTKGVPNGSWSGSNHDTVIPTPDTNCTNLKNRGIKVSILYIPFQPINPVNASFAGDEDDAANNNIPHIPASLQACASPPDASGSYFYTANTPQDIQDSLQAMFNHAIATARLTQ